MIYLYSLSYNSKILNTENYVLFVYGKVTNFLLLQEGIDDVMAEFYNPEHLNPVNELVGFLEDLRASPRPPSAPAGSWYAVAGPSDDPQPGPNPQAPPNPIWRPYAIGRHCEGGGSHDNPANLDALPLEFEHLRICNGCAVAAQSSTPENIDVNSESPELTAPLIPDWLFRESDDDEG